MSGFIAIYNNPVDSRSADILEMLMRHLKERGPDRQSIWASGPVALGHSLFKTTDEAKYEQQPATVDGKVWITCSARIDGRESLVDKLGIKKEVNLAKTPDSDLILHAYRKWGEQCLDHLIGDFAFVIWDSMSDTIFCARDPFGSRQLYYATARDDFVVSNSLSCLLEHPNISRRFDDKAMGGFLILGDHSWIDKSITAFADVATLPPAHKLIYRRGKISIQRYWELPRESPLLRYRKESDYIEHFLEVFEACVADRLRTPSVAISMSGGLDSTAIAATIGHLKRHSTHPLTSVRAITGLHEKLTGCNERYYASLVADHLGIPIDYISADDYPLLKSGLVTSRPLEMLMPTYWLDFKKLVLRHSRVELTGASADNLFAFSPPTTLLKDVRSIRPLIELIRVRLQYATVASIGGGLYRKFKRSVGMGEEAATPPYPSWINPDLEKELGLKELWRTCFEKLESSDHPRHPRASAFLQAPDWNADDVAFRPGLALPEERDPYLDLRMVHFAFSLPPTPWFSNKHLMRRSMQGLLPREVLRRPKTPLGDLQSKLVKRPESRWIDNWTARPELKAYIALGEIPPLLGQRGDDIDQTYINIRPVILNAWISAMAS